MDFYSGNEELIKKGEDADAGIAGEMETLGVDSASNNKKADIKYENLTTVSVDDLLII